MSPSAALLLALAPALQQRDGREWSYVDSRETERGLRRVLELAAGATRSLQAVKKCSPNDFFNGLQGPRRLRGPGTPAPAGFNCESRVNA